jgi:hypothetical protein
MIGLFGFQLTRTSNPWHSGLHAAANTLVKVIDFHLGLEMIWAVPEIARAAG